MTKTKKVWRFTEARKKSLAKAQKIHVEMVEAGRRVLERSGKK